MGARKVDPYHLLFQGGQFYLLGHSHERERAARLPPLAHPRQGRLRDEGRARLQAPRRLRPARLRQPRRLAVRRRRAATAEIWISERIAWQVERHFGRYGEVAPAERRRRRRLRDAATPTPASSSSWVLRPRRARARRSARPSWSTSVAERVALLAERHARRARAAPREPPRAPRGAAGDGAAAERRRRRARGRDPPRALRAPRDARDRSSSRPAAPASALRRRRGLRAPADLRRRAARGRQRPQRRELRRRLLRALRRGRTTTATIEVDPEPYSDNFARPARLLPVEAKALVAAIDLIGEHLPEGSLTSRRARRSSPRSARTRWSRACRSPRAGGDDSDDRARRLARRSPAAGCCELDYYKANEDEFSERTVEPYALINGREGWYVAVVRPRARRRPPLPPGPHQARRGDRRGVRAAARGRPGRRRRRAGRAPARSQASRIARVWVSPERARWAREERARRRRSSPTARSSSSWPSRAPTGSCARCSRRPATPPSSSPPTRARRCSRPWRSCARSADRLAAGQLAEHRAEDAAGRVGADVDLDGLGLVGAVEVDDQARAGRGAAVRGSRSSTWHDVAPAWAVVAKIRVLTVIAFMGCLRRPLLSEAAAAFVSDSLLRFSPVRQLAEQAAERPARSRR